LVSSVVCPFLGLLCLFALPYFSRNFLRQVCSFDMVL
jgi:hypothetical protein